MKRPTIFILLTWISVIATILIFWSRHLVGNSTGFSGLLGQFLTDLPPSAVPLLERFLNIAPSSMTILLLLLISGGVWMAYLWFRPEDHRKPLVIRPITVFMAWLLLVICMGSLSMGDIWNTTALPVTAEQEAAILVQEFPGLDPLQVNGFVMFFSMVGHVLHGIFALLILVLAAVGAGTMLRRFFPKEGISSAGQLLLLLGLGFSTLIVLALICALTGIWGISLFFVPVPTILLLVSTVLALWKEGPFLFSLLTKKYTLSWSREEGYIQPFFVLGLMLVVAASFLHILRPIPIGWDDIGVYMNVPSLVAQHGALVGGFGSYNWGLLMSLGFLVWNTPYVAMLFSFLGGLLAFFGLHVLITFFIQQHKGGEQTGSSIPLFLVTAFAMSPFVLFQLGEDMKIDLGLLFLSTVAVYITVLLWNTEKMRRLPWYLMLGGVLGVALGVKLTAVLLVIFVMSLLVSKMLGALGFTALVAFSIMILLAGNIFSIGGLAILPSVRLALLCITGLIGLVAAIKASLIHKAFKSTALFLGATVLGIILTFSPWFIFNVQSWCTEGCPPPSLTLFLYSKSPQPLLPADVQVASDPLAVEGITGSGVVLSDAVELKNTLQLEGGSVTEELGRYAGFDESILKYLSLPFDTTFSINVMGDYVTVGWLYLALSALATYWGLTQYSGKKYFAGTLAVLVLFLLTVISGMTGQLSDAPSWMVHGVTLGVALLIFWTIKQIGARGIPLKNASLTVHFALATVVYVFFWMYAASGVVWYGITAVIGILILGGVALYQMAQDKESRKHYVAFIVLILLFWILPMFVYKLTTSETNIRHYVLADETVKSTAQVATSYDTRYFTLFKAGILDQKTGLQYFNGEYYAASELLNKETTSKIYRVGTLLPYFIDANDTRITSDNQLDQFIATFLPKADTEYMLKRMYESGYRFIVLDLGTDSIDKTAEKTLTKKVDIFQSFVNNDALGTAQRDLRGERIFTNRNPHLREALRASSFIIWSIQPPQT